MQEIASTEEAFKILKAFGSLPLGHYISYRTNTGGDDSQQDDSVPEAGEGTVLILYSLMCVTED